MKNQAKKTNPKKGEKLPKKYSKRMMVGGALGIIALSTTGIASASFGDPQTREAIKSAFEAKSFSAFQQAAKDTPIIEKIDNEEKFNKLIEAQELRESGDKQAAKAIKQELGLKGGLHGKGAKGKNPEVRAAIEAADYSAFREAINDGHFGEKIDSAEKFAKLVEVNELRASGEFEKAKEIMNELGISHKDRKGKNRTVDKQ